jgi:hypothetical protein
MRRFALVAILAVAGLPAYTVSVKQSDNRTATFELIAKPGEWYSNSEFSLALAGRELTPDSIKSTRMGDLGASIHLIADASKSVAGDWDQIRKYCASLLEQTRDGDSVTLYILGPGQKATDRKTALDLLAKVGRPTGNTQLYDQLLEANRSFIAEPKSDGLLIIVSDGYDDGSHSDSISNLSIPVHFVNIRTAVPESIKRLVEETGGSTSAISGDPADVLRDVMSRTGTSYSVTFDLPLCESTATNAEFTAGEICKSFLLETSAGSVVESTPSTANGTKGIVAMLVILNVLLGVGVVARRRKA